MTIPPPDTRLNSPCLPDIGRNTGKREMLLCAPTVNVKQKWVQALRTKTTPARRAGDTLIVEGWVTLPLGLPASVPALLVACGFSDAELRKNNG